MGRLAEVATSKDRGPSISEPWPPAAFPLVHAAGGGISHSRRPASRTRPSPHSPLPRHPYPGGQRPRVRR